MIIFGLNGTAAFKTLFDLAVKKVANKWIVLKEAQKKGLLVRSFPTHHASEGSLAVHKRFLKPEYFAIEERLKEKSQEKRRRSQVRKLRGWEVLTPLSLPLNKGRPLKNFIFEDHDVQPFRRQSQLLQWLLFVKWTLKNIGFCDATVVPYGSSLFP